LILAALVGIAVGTALEGRKSPKEILSSKGIFPPKGAL
jgi:hypothetical protein